MKRLELDLRPLAGPAVAVALAAALLAACWYIGGHWRAPRADAFRDARAELARAASRYRNASDDQRVYEEYANRFRDMRAAGWIGAEQRLGWIEALQAINAQLRLPTLGYDISERTPVTARTATSHLALHRTPMTLRFGALHEGDAIDLLERLQATGAGLMSVERCDFARNGARVHLEAGAANVQVECALDWYSLRMLRRKPPAGDAEEP